MQTVYLNALDFFTRKIRVDAYDLLKQVCIDRLVLSVRLDLLQDSVSDRTQHAAKNFNLELGVSLLRQTRNRAHLHVETIKVLEKALHPLDHDLVVSPAQLKLLE